MSKSKYSYIGISFIILVFGIIFIPRIIDRIKDGDIVRGDRMSTGIESEDNKALAYIKINGKAKKVPEFAFTNQDGLIISNDDYKGQVYVVEFFFTTCPSICPIMNVNLVQLQEEFKEFDNFGVASFTITPEIDTPMVLKQYAEKYGITNPNWHLMTGDKTMLYDLANAGFNIFAKEDPNVPGGFEHSGHFALIDKQGFIRSRKDKYGNPIVYYRGAVPFDQAFDEEIENEQITILKEDIKKLLAE
jgi:protein SCO1/2